MLLGENLPPVTTGAAYFVGDPDEVVAAFVDWQRPLLERRGIRLEVVAIGALSARPLLCLAFPVVATVERTQYLFVPRSDRTGVAVYDNAARGPDPASIAAVLHSRLPSGRAIAVTHVDDRTGDPGVGGDDARGLDVAAGLVGLERRSEGIRIRGVGASIRRVEWSRRRKRDPRPRRVRRRRSADSVTCRRCSRTRPDLGWSGARLSLRGAVRWATGATRVSAGFERRAGCS